MTPDQMENLARTLTAHHRWKWTPGMLAVVPPAHDGSTGYMLRISSTMDQPPARAYPDLTDSATVGCLLALTRKVRRDPSWRPTPIEHDPGTIEWVVERPSPQRQTLHPSEVSAIASAFCAKSNRRKEDPVTERKANLESMAVTVTLVFSDEAHREAWLTREGLFDGPDGKFRRLDYESRKGNTNLTFIVGVEGPK